MSEAVLAALITGAAAVLGNIITSSRTQRSVHGRLEKHQAVTATKLEELTREVREHNNFARRMPVVEEEIKTLKKTVDALQGYHMHRKE